MHQGHDGIALQIPDANQGSLVCMQGLYSTLRVSFLFCNKERWAFKQ